MKNIYFHLANVKKKLARFLVSIKQLNIKDSISNLEPCDVLFFCHDVDRGISLEKKAYSPLIDSINDDFKSRGLKCHTISHPWSVVVGSNGHGNPVAINRSYLIALFKNKILKIFNKRNQKNDYIFLLYYKILSITKPKIIITIGCQESLCRAARQADIFHAELLHGIGYKFLPWGYGDRNITDLPQVILSLDQTSTKSFMPIVKKGIIIKEIQHPFLKRFLKNDVLEIPKEWNTKKNININYRKQILISITWGYSGDHGEHTQFKGVLSNGMFPEELIKIIDETKEEIFWRFRFHPVQIRMKKYKRLLDFMDRFVEKNINCEWRESSYLPFPSIVQTCDGNISMSSMSAYDAAYMGVPSLMLCPNIQIGGIHENWFEDLVEKGYVTKSLASYININNWVKITTKKEPLLGNFKSEDNWEDTVEWMLGSHYKDNKEIA